MIVYNKTKEEFENDILTNEIDKIIEKHLLKVVGHRVAKNEMYAFRNSLSFMDKVLHDNEIPKDCGISIEYHIPQTSKRIDFIISGSNDHSENLIIVELKQWQKAKLTSKDGIVITRFQHGELQHPHPSYQAWTYAAIMKSYNAVIDEDGIELFPCAYLHNYEYDGVITNDFYKHYIEKAPIFLRPDAVKLRSFIKRFIKYGDETNILYRIDNGKIRPTKSLADALASMLKGNEEFIMIDDQKVVYEHALYLARRSTEKNKNVLIVEGGPGTGKSVIAINLLVELNRHGKIAQYVTKTSAPREVYFSKLVGDKKKVELKSLFVGSGSFINAPPNIIPTLIVDEAHRLTEKTGYFRQGDNQIKEILDASCCSIFFIDEDQRIHIEDYGKSSLIEKFAKERNITVHKLTLKSQFRCNGSDGYLAWVDDTLQIRETANKSLASLDIGFDFQVFDNPVDLRNIIFEKNKEKNKARLVAGYCWDWISKKDKSKYDICFPEYGFKMKWNFFEDGGTWIIGKDSVNEIGCIHTAQGLEVDYIGVIIGDDLIVRNGKVICDPSKRSKMDRTIFGWQKLMDNDPNKAKALINSIIKNTYRTLMTRGLKGCYIYCTDKETEMYFKDRLR